MNNLVKYFGNEEKYIKAVLNSEYWSSTSGSWTSLVGKNFKKIFRIGWGWFLWRMACTPP